MVRFHRIVVLMIPAVFLVTAPSGARAAEADPEILSLLAEVPLIDGHNDLPWQLRERFGGRLDQVDISDTTDLTPPMHTDLGRLREGRVGGVFWSLFVPVELPPDAALKATLEQADLVHRMVAAHPEALRLATTADEVVAAHAAGRVASLMGVEGAHSLAGSPSALRMLARLGVRYLTLTHWDGNVFADAATSPPRHGGLSAEGRQLLAEMERLGILADLSHVSDAVMGQVLDAARGPVVFSHSSARALCDHPRNVPDAMLGRLRENGGVVMVNFAAFFLSDAFQDWVAELEAERGRLKARLPAATEAERKARVDAWIADHPAPTTPLSVLADHLDHLKAVAGAEHVGLGSDYDGVLALPEGMEDVAAYPRLLTELKRRGWTREELAGLVGLNVLRVLRESEALAASLSEAPPWEPGTEPAG